MIDSHCHLTRLTRLSGDADPIASLSAVVSVGTSVDDARATLAIAERDPRVFAAVGIHPNSASDARSAATREAIEQLATHRRVVAIGETGFDDHWQDETLSTQLEAFEWHADLAQRLGKPLVLHVRDRQGGSAASHAAASAITAAGHGLGVLHCFNGDATLYEAALRLGWYVSFAGNITYKSAVPIREVAAAAPLDRLLVETDSPYLAPMPHRGRPNVPDNVRLNAARLAEVRGMDEAELELRLDANARRLFRLELTA
ncbi:MAG TPA: TatD family hydrolase [Trueperaceae bacterium]|nr:TatD family hydrolase [Trueperaceae bacterium]